MHTEMKIPELTKCILKLTENTCFLLSAGMLEGFSYARILMTAESGLSMFLTILSNSSRNRHKRSHFNIKLYLYYLNFFAFLISYSYVTRVWVLFCFSSFWSRKEGGDWGEFSFQFYKLALNKLKEERTKKESLKKSFKTPKTCLR